MIKVFSSGLLDSNTYVVWSKSGHAMVVDCGNPPEKIIKFIENERLCVDYIVLTHAHYDHIAYIDEYAKAYPEAKLVCHKDELCVINDSEGNLSSYFNAARSYVHDYYLVNEDEIISLKDEKSGRSVDFRIIHAPGHTIGCICLFNEEEKIMLTGDVLFANGYGRTDLKYADPQKMRLTLYRLIPMLKGITIYPGHGDSTEF
ncbi:MAG: MBL fold metallo-hydrolase [Clostridia bacterium]|nr:MBL fold metallo-hydrolase [Clostridia bacterium]